MEIEKYREGSIRAVLDEWRKAGYILSVPELGEYGWTMKARFELKWWGRDVTPQIAAAKFVEEEDLKTGW